MAVMTAPSYPIITRQALRYFGSKWRDAPRIIDYIEEIPHVCYCEPYCGGAGVWQRKEPSHYEVLNDLDGEVVNYFKVLRERPDELIRAIELTPFSRAEYRLSYQPCPEDPVEWARRFYVRCWQSWGGKISGWRFQRTHHAKNNVKDWNKTEQMWAISERLKLVQLECDDALKIIKRYDTAETLFFVDPPYPTETRSSKNGYRYEMDRAAHRRLAEVLHGVQGKVILCSYPSAQYDELYGDWRKATYRTTANNTTVPGSQARTECLWIKQ